jgi:hypothetical protein
MKDLGLHMSDKEILEANTDLTDNIINAAHAILRKQYPHIQGLQDTILGQKLQFTSVASNQTSVQILHTGTYMHVSRIILCSYRTGNLRLSHSIYP